MFEATESVAMAKKKVGRPRTSDRDDITVKVDRTIVSRARVVASYRGVTLAEYLSELLDQPVQRGYSQMVREMAEAEGEGKG